MEDEIDIEDLIEEEECVFSLSHAGYIKRTPVSAYRTQKRGGKGVNAQNLREEDYVETLFTCSTHDFILFFTNIGKVHRKKGYQIPEAGRVARGTNLVNVLPLEPGEKVTAMIHCREFREDAYLMLATRNGTVKRINLAGINTARKAGIRALTLDEGDSLIAVRFTMDGDEMLLATHDGMAIRFAIEDVRCMGRDAVGVRGIKLREGDYVVGAEVVGHGEALLTITEKGYGKRTLAEEYSIQSRGGYGNKNYNITAKTGSVVATAIVKPRDDVLIISDDGTMIRTSAGDISVYSRVTQGVRVMNLSEGVKVISLAKTRMYEMEELKEAENAPSEKSVETEE